MSKQTVVITIGRNIGSRPMIDVEWAAFKSAVTRALLASKAIIIQHPHIEGSSLRDQVGVWDGEREGAATYVAFVDDSQVTFLRTYLANIKPIYQQEAIGFLVVDGTDHVI